MKPRRPSGAFIAPMLPTLVSQPPEGTEWLHEIKHDGYRTQIDVAGDATRAFTRNGHDWSERYAHVLAAAGRLACATATLDGEVIVQDENGRSDFRALRSAIERDRSRLVFYAFDLLALDGRDLRSAPLIERRSILGELIGEHDPSYAIQYSEHHDGDGAALFGAACGIELEGIVSKRATSRYRSGRTQNWLKTKCYEEADFTVIGAERGKGPAFALLAREISDGLEYAGSAFVTLAEPERDRFWREVERLAVDRAPIPMEKRPKTVWMRPELRVSAQYLGGPGSLRHATLRELL